MPAWASYPEAYPKEDTMKESNLESWMKSLIRFLWSGSSHLA